MIKILAISGSLRKTSSNTALLAAAASLAPERVAIYPCTTIGSLPIFNPDLEGFEPPSVINFRNQLREAQGIMIASPEYAHGVTGAIKNALDWVVGSGEFVGKPVALINASSRSTIAFEALKETIQTMDAKVIPLSIPLAHSNIDLPSILTDPLLSQSLRSAIHSLILKIAL